MCAQHSEHSPRIRLHARRQQRKRELYGVVADDPRTQCRPGRRATGVEHCLERGTTLEPASKSGVQRGETRRPATDERHRQQRTRFPPVEHGKRRREVLDGGPNVECPGRGVPVPTVDLRERERLSAPTDAATRTFRFVEYSSTRSEKESEKRLDLRAPVAHGRRRKKEHSCALRKPRKPRVPRSQRIAGMMCLIYDDEIRAFVRIATAQRFEGDERQRRGRAMCRLAPHPAERRGSGG